MYQDLGIWIGSVSLWLQLLPNGFCIGDTRVRDQADSDQKGQKYEELMSEALGIGRLEVLLSLLKLVTKKQLSKHLKVFDSCFWVEKNCVM